MNKIKRLMLVAVAVAGLMAGGREAEARTMPFLTYAPYRELYPTVSPFISSGNMPSDTPAPSLMGRSLIPGFGNKIWYYNNSPGEWKVYKDFEFEDFTVYTKGPDGNYIYYQRTLKEFRLGMGSRIREWSQVDGVITLKRDTGWLYIFSWELFWQDDWDRTTERSELLGDSGNYYFSQRLTFVQWKLANIYPHLMPSDAEVILTWSGWAWKEPEFYQTANNPIPWRYSKSECILYPMGVLNMIISNPYPKTVSFLCNRKVDSVPQILSADSAVPYPGGS
jgi:hypothetical protein